MIKAFICIGAVVLALGAVGALPQPLSNQTTNRPPSTRGPAVQTNRVQKTKGRPAPGPFHGKLAAVDRLAKTVTVGKRTFLVTAETKIKKAGKPATLADAVVGEPASGYVKPAPDGKLLLSTLNLGPKRPGEAGKARSPKTGRPPGP